MAEVLLFSYGTLQDPAVQQANFGRLLTGTPDGLTGFVIGEVEITDAEVIAESGLTHHLILHPSDDPTETIPGMVFRITEDELAAADVYEAEEYRRVLVPLTSGLEAWVYIAA
ncbi:gamma-glutamylcyclotransferase family protein [Brevundimonas sp.]